MATADMPAPTPTGPAVPPPATPTPVPQTAATEEEAAERANLPPLAAPTVSPTQLAPTVPAPLAASASMSGISNVPLLMLRGCTPIPDLMDSYELRLGAQDFASGQVVWQLSLENLSPTRPLEYLIYTVKDGGQDEGWMSLSRHTGVLEPLGRHVLTLTVSTKRMDTLSTYMIIENLSVPSNMKTVFVTMDVVAKHNAHFAVIVNGKANVNPVLQFGEVHYNQSYTNRSFIISNTSTLPLDFLLTTNLPPYDSTEVGFSLSQSSRNLCNALTVNPMSQVKVFVYFHPTPPLGSTLDGQAPVGSTEYPHAREIKIFLNCRLVKDFQQVITLTASCRYPQMLLSASDAVFEGRMMWTGDGPQGLEETQAKPAAATANKKKLPLLDLPAQVKRVTLSNLYVTPLRYSIRNPSLYFVIDVESTPPSEDPSAAGDDAGGHSVVQEDTIGNSISSVVNKFASVTLAVRLNQASISEQMANLLRVRYIEEHVTVYNMDAPCEHYVITLRISIGCLRDFSSIQSARGSHAHRFLEGSIVRYLKDFKTFWATHSAALTSPSSTSPISVSPISSPPPLSIGEERTTISPGAKEGLDASATGRVVAPRPMTSPILSALLNLTTSLSSSASPPTSSPTPPTAPSSTGSIKSEADGLLERVAQASRSEQYTKLSLELLHITNELILFGLRKPVSQLATQLGALLFGTLFKHRVIQQVVSLLSLRASSSSSSSDRGMVPSVLDSLMSCLGDFLSYFPEKRDDLDMLRTLDYDVRTALGLSQDIANKKTTK
eukprot:TRINITY_DN3354_c0_g1_i1.p1 TRINITY_DN3354_c0_g1~~TRINITY_DN3354_c0_g1_i1.p1  ORF type:complete len:889 (+),score=244.34 TRINITY_DN3354_c0_g1_i1:340-2667(+)